LAVVSIASGVVSPGGEQFNEPIDQYRMENKPFDAITELDLQTAQWISLANSPTVEAAAERINQARERVYQAKSAYWPSIDGNLSGSRIHFSNNSRNFSPAYEAIFGSQGSRDDEFIAGISASWALFDGFERRFATAAARYDELGSESAFRDAQRLLLSTVATAYLLVQLERENFRIAQADEEFNLRLEKEAEARYRLGAGSLSDVLNFQVQVNAARSELIRARRIYEIALYGLAELLNVPGGKIPDHVKVADLVDETKEELLIPEPDEMIHLAQIHRPDLNRAVFAVRSAEENLGVQRAGYYPRIELAAEVAGRRIDSARFESDDFGNTIGIFLRYNLFSGGLTRAREAEAKYQINEIEKQVESLSIAITTEVLTALESLKAAGEELKLQRSNAELVRQNRDLVEKEYNAGQTSLVRLNEAQRDLIAAQSRLALALASLRQAWKNLDAATGTILNNFVTRVHVSKK
jgi:outer membrane protein TolC